MIYSDGFASFDEFIDVGYDTHFCVSHGDNAYASSYRHGNGMEGFWGCVQNTSFTVLRHAQGKVVYALEGMRAWLQ